MRDLEEDLDLRCRVNLYAKNAILSPIEAANQQLMTQDVNADDEDDEEAAFPDISLDELIGDLGLEPPLTSAEPCAENPQFEVGQKRQHDRHQ